MNYQEAHCAIKRGDLTQLQEAIPASLAPDTANKFGWTLLMLTAIQGNTKMGEFLLEAGASPSELNQFGDSALSLAAHSGHLPFVRLLLQAGATAPLPRPNGQEFSEWMRISSGLTDDKINAILEVINAHIKED